MREIGEAYDRAAALWTHGSEAVYARMAAAMLAHCPVPLPGAAVLDVGAGTGVVSRLASRHGARHVVAIDLARGMLERVGPAASTAVADATSMPFRDGTFDVVAAAFCLGHFPDPVAGLVEMRRAGGAVLASAFAPGPPHPAKAAVDGVLTARGFVMPDWYAHLKNEREPQVDDPDALRDVARAAGLADFRVTEVEVDAGLDSPGAVVAWRFGMAHLAPYVSTMTTPAREEARAAAVDVVRGMPPVRIRMLVLTVP